MCSSDLSRCEQAIAHARDLRTRQRAELEAANASHQEAATLLARDEAEHVALSETLAALEPSLVEARAREAEARAALRAAEDAMQGFQQRWEAFTREGAEANQKAMVERARIEQLDGRLRRSLQQQERVHAERDRLSGEDLTATLSDLTQRRDEAQRTAEAAQARMQSLLEDRKSTRLNSSH